MCFICSPAQSIFYKNETLNVCTEYCDRYYEACNGIRRQRHTLLVMHYNDRVTMHMSQHFTLTKQPVHM